MLNKLVLSGLTVLTLFIFSGTANAQNSHVLYSQHSMMGPERAVSFYRSDVMQSDVVSASYYGEGEPGAARATYTQTITAVPTKSVTTVTYRKYVRPSDTETEEVYLKSMDPVITSKTSIGVPPHGYNYYTEKPNIPIRDFRASMWKTNYYVAKFYKDEKNDKALYGYNAGY